MIELLLHVAERIAVNCSCLRKFSIKDVIILLIFAEKVGDLLYFCEVRFSLERKEN